MAKYISLTQVYQNTSLLCFLQVRGGVHDGGGGGLPDGVRHGVGEEVRDGQRDGAADGVRGGHRRRHGDQVSQRTGKRNHNG